MTQVEVGRSDRTLLVHHVAKRLGVARRTVRWWAETGRIRAYRAGVKLWTFREADVDELRSVGRSNRNRREQPFTRPEVSAEWRKK